MQSTDPINSYVIVGGGTAGWISAAILARTLQNTTAKMTVVESPHIPTIGVGEATIPSIIDLVEFLNIPLHDFILKTNATFKLGIKFIDWQQKNHHYWHPFGYIGNKIDGKPFYQHWLKYNKNNGNLDFTDFSPAIALAKQNKFFVADPKYPTNLSSSTYALHFDAGLVAEYLQQYCKQHNVIHIQAHVKTTQLNNQGEISHVVLDNAQQIAGDFFIDCSGQKALLIQKALRVGYRNWQHFLPVDKAIAVQSNKQEILKPYTESTAHEHGWRWQIPLQNRTGNGYVFSSDFCNVQEAINVLENNVQNWITDPKTITFTTGQREKTWYKNCLAVGLSAGFLEPLESTSIYLIMKTMLNFVKNLPRQKIYPATTNEFNRLVDKEYEDIRDFIILHYCETKRTDSPFWQMWQNLTIPDSLQHKLDLFKGQGQLHHNQDDLFSSDSWYAVLNGMGVKPQTYDPIIDTSKYEIIEQAMKRSAQALMHSAAQTLDHQDYIQKMKK